MRFKITDPQNHSLHDAGSNLAVIGALEVNDAAALFAQRHQTTRICYEHWHGKDKHDEEACRSLKNASLTLSTLRPGSHTLRASAVAMDGTTLSSSLVYFQAKEPSPPAASDSTESAQFVEVVVDGEPARFVYRQGDDLYDAVKKFCLDKMIQPAVMCMDSLARAVGIPKF